MSKTNGLRLSLMIVMFSGVFTVTACKRQDDTAKEANAQPTVTDTNASTISEQPAKNTVDQAKKATPVVLRGKALEDALSALRKKIKIPTGDGTSPYQIQLGVDNKIESTLIGTKPNLDLIFTNQDGKTVNIAKSYPGKVLVISTIFTSCPMPGMCPRLTADFADLEISLPDELKDFVQFILVSFDPKRDTPEVLQAFGEQHGIDFAHTDLLCAPIEQTKALMDDSLQIPLDVNPETNTIVTHAMMLDIINRDGFVVVERTVATSEPMATIADEIVRAVLLPFDPNKVPGGENAAESGEGG